jgi:hypothetical protein
MSIYVFKGVGVDIFLLALCGKTPMVVVTVSIESVHTLIVVSVDESALKMIVLAV